MLTSLESVSEREKERQRRVEIGGEKESGCLGERVIRDVNEQEERNLNVSEEAGEKGIKRQEREEERCPCSNPVREGEIRLAVAVTLKTFSSQLFETYYNKP